MAKRTMTVGHGDPFMGDERVYKIMSVKNALNPDPGKWITKAELKRYIEEGFEVTVIELGRR